MLTPQEQEIRKKAAIIAALSSNHSWSTCKYLRGYSALDRSSVASEAAEAIRTGWKNITEADVDEVVNGDIKPHMFSMWMFYALEDKQRNEYGQIFGRLRKEYEYGLEPSAYAGMKQ